MTCIGEPEKVSLCHCLACQRRTYGIAAFFRRDALSIEGASNCYTRPSDSGFPVSFHFCPGCGSTVWWEPRRMPELIAVAVGAFADPDFPAPTQAVHSEFRHRWAGDIPG
ncbi:GFA family protein [Nitratireductor sp. GCM10026969]|uniref:GFA family protein n=1 Tax=Nitratireductor sp. GCM10026969 TaxID=3252645 RepID=UPI0036121C96